MILATSDVARTKPWVTSTSTLARELLAKRLRALGSSESVDQTTGYVKELHRRALLAPSEERLLFAWLSELKRHASEIAEIPDEVRCEQTCRDLAEIEQEIVVVRNHLVESNLRLVVAAARKFRGPVEVEFPMLSVEPEVLRMAPPKRI